MSKSINRTLKTQKIGQTKISNQGFLMTIVDYIDSKHIVIEFNDRYKTHKIDEYTDFKKGNIQNPSVNVLYRKFIAYKDDIKQNPLAFEKYRAMADRCYGDQTGNNKVYKGCQICEEWYQFENFVKWFNENYYQIENETMELDKDIFGNGKLYSPQNCVFITHKLNSWFTRTRTKKRPRTLLAQTLPIGVTIHKTKNGTIRYRVVDLPKNQLFDDINEARKAYCNFINQQYKDYANIHKTQLPKKLYDYLVNYNMAI